MIAKFLVLGAVMSVGATILFAAAAPAAPQPPAMKPSTTKPAAPSAGPPAGFKLKGDAAAGKTLYVKNCALCHGETGNGRGLVKYDPPPRDLTDVKLMSGKSEWEFYRVVRDGGKPWGMSPAMLAWKGQLTEQQLHDVTLYVRSLSRPKK